MLFILMFFAIFSITLTLGSIGSDLNCTELVNGTNIYLSSAVSCQNTLSDESCAIIFPSINPDFPEIGSSSPRPPNCYRNLKTVSPEVIQKRAKGIAVAFCPRTCGFCCETDNVRMRVELRTLLGLD